MDTRFLYVGSAPCGCVLAAVVDDPEHPKDVAKDVASFIRDGMTVVRQPNPGVSPFTRCAPHKDIPTHKEWIAALGRDKKGGPRA